MIMDQQHREEIRERAYNDTITQQDKEEIWKDIKNNL